MSANIELVTSHKGTPHITADQVRDLLAGFSGDIDGIKVFSNLDDAFEYSIEDATTVRIKTGQALAAGYHFQLLDAYDWLLDPGVVGYSRYDSLYLVIYEDPITLVQTADFVYQVGELYQNGTTGTVPGPPTGTNIKEEWEFMRVNSSDGSIVVVEPKFTDYLSNKQLETNVSGTVTQVETNKEALNGLRFGIDANGKYGYYKVGADTVTPFRNPEGTAEASEVLANKTFSTALLENAVGTMPNRGAINGSVNPGDAYVIPEGYHDGQGRVTGNKNTGTYNFQAGSTGATIDMGDTNLNRYVNAAEVRTTGRKDQSSHTITANISGSTDWGFQLIISVDGVAITTVNASGTIGETFPGSGQYSCNLSGTFVGKTSYSGGLKV